MANPPVKAATSRLGSDLSGNFAEYKPGDKQFYSAMVPSPSLAYPLSLKNSVDNVPFIHLNVVDPVASQARSNYAIGLYMPTSIRTSYNASWQEIELGILGQEALNISNGAFGSVTGAAQAGVAKAMGNVLNSTGLNIGAAAQKKLGIMVNPHAALLFNGMAFREFKLDFVFFPKSAKESAEVADIIFQLKYAMHPEGSDALGANGGTADLSRFLQYPNNFILGFYAPGMHWLFRTSPCALIGCDVEYNGSGVPAFFQNSNEPVCITMSLHFKENEILTKQRIRLGW